MYFSQLLWCCWGPHIKAAKEHLGVILLITNECARVKKQTKQKKDLWTSLCVCMRVCVCVCVCVCVSGMYLIVPLKDKKHD